MTAHGRNAVGSGCAREKNKTPLRSVDCSPIAPAGISRRIFRCFRHTSHSAFFFHLNLGNKKPCDLQGAQGVSRKILFEILKLAAHLLAVRDWGDKSRPRLDRDVARPSLAIRISRGNDAEMCFVLSLLYSKRVLS